METKKEWVLGICDTSKSPTYANHEEPPFEWELEYETIYNSLILMDTFEVNPLIFDMFIKIRCIRT